MEKMTETKLSIGGRFVSYTIQNKDIDEIQFYHDNPRIATIVDSLREVTETGIDEALWNLPQTHELKRTIEQDGGLIHPVIVYENKVLEGNTRLCCYRHLFSEFKDGPDNKWSKIPCQIINEELSKDDIYRLLCSEHINGKIEWDAWEKAHFFFKMQSEGKSSEDIAKIAKESVSSVNNKIKAYRLMVDSGVCDKNKYSYFEQIVLSKAIREIKTNNDPQIENKIINKIKDGTIQRAETIRKVGDIYKHKDFRKEAFTQNRVLEDVYHDLKANAPMTDSPFMKTTEDLLNRVKNLTREEREAINGNTRDRSKIEYLTKELVHLCNEMNIKIHVPKKNGQK